MGKCKGKSVLSKLLPCKKDKDSIPPPPPPPPPYTKYSKSPSSKPHPPTYNHASMHFQPPHPQTRGITANHMPKTASGVAETKDGFNVWCIKGYNGFVEFPRNGDPVQTLGRLETMNQVMHSRHGYDIEKVRGGTTNTGGEEGSDGDDDGAEPGAVVEDVEDDSDAESSEEEEVVEVKKKSKPAAGMVKDREYKDITVKPPSYYTWGHSKKGTRANLNCVHCENETTQPVKKIKAAGNTPMCWACVLGHYAAAAQYVWDGHTFGP